MAQFWEIGSLNVATVSKHDLDTAFPTIGLTETSTVATEDAPTEPWSNKVVSQAMGVPSRHYGYLNTTLWYTNIAIENDHSIELNDVPLFFGTVYQRLNTH